MAPGRIMDNDDERNERGSVYDKREIVFLVGIFYVADQSLSRDGNESLRFNIGSAYRRGADNDRS